MVFLLKKYDNIESKADILISLIFTELVGPWIFLQEI